MMQVYTPASSSVTLVMVRLSETMVNLETKHSHRQFSATSDQMLEQRAKPRHINEEADTLLY